MRMTIIMMTMASVLSGCLTTGKPVLTSDNSTLASESEAFKAYVEAWEQQAGPVDSPRGIIESQQRLFEVEGLMVIEEIKSTGTAEYYAVGMLGSRPVACFAHDAQIDEIAAPLGVTVDVQRDDKSDGVGPAPVFADGPKPALAAFVREVFKNGAIACFAPPKGGLK